MDILGMGLPQEMFRIATPPIVAVVSSVEVWWVCLCVENEGDAMRTHTGEGSIR
jgi:hypothetical protein